jgi:hypothetical protein
MNEAETDAMIEAIVAAIENRRLVSLLYHDVQRLVRPHILGLVGEGVAAFSGWQVTGTAAGWRQFHLAEIDMLTATDRRFHQAAPGYNSRDPAFSKILLHL